MSVLSTEIFAKKVLSTVNHTAHTVTRNVVVETALFNYHVLHEHFIGI